MSFMTNIVQWLNSVTGYFYDIYLEVLGWPDPFWRIYAPFYFLYNAFNYLAWEFSDFGTWVNEVAYKITTILDLTDIYLGFKTLFDAGVNAWNWVVDAVTNVLGIVDSWWSSTQYTVQGWISDATTTLQLLINELSTSYQQLITAWDNFKGRIPTLDEVTAWWSNWTGELLSVVNSWWTGAMVEVQGLIDSAFLARDSFWAGWQDWRDQVTEFFTDPEDWLYKSFDRIIERFW